MSGTVWKIDRQPAGYRINRGNFAETPTAVHAKTTLGEMHQRRYVFTADSASGDQFVEFFFHI
jgi:hypothetical protein